MVVIVRPCISYRASSSGCTKQQRLRQQQRLQQQRRLQQQQRLR